MEPPIIKLYKNPWSEMLPDGVLLQALMTAAVTGQEMLDAWKKNEEEPADKSFGMVILDPTRPRGAGLEELVLATVELGGNGAKYLPNGLAKAEAHERHDEPNGTLLHQYPSYLGNDDFMWGNSADYGAAIAGGSGLTPQHDGQLAEIVLCGFIDRIEDHLAQWTEEMKSKEGSHRWFNSDDHVPARYRIFDRLEVIAEHE